ncbi:PREDICTED: cytochrome P450 71A1-like [Nelumbo nucifera]|uniref:Cytochrome P450 71A1-like n=1 Tax=Nelumbo nucifera TaxID=4432 RepID=A0A1U8Q8J0_NELNU|nr:PREDICTED: cytochrome P450 71A1-like [Nelumbo nucifera]
MFVVDNSKSSDDLSTRPGPSIHRPCVPSRPKQKKVPPINQLELELLQQRIRHRLPNVVRRYFLQCGSVGIHRYFPTWYVGTSSNTEVPTLEKVSEYTVFPTLDLLQFPQQQVPAYHNYSGNVRSSCQSPTRIPIIRNFHPLGTLPHRSLKALSQKYGPLMLLHLGSVPLLVVSTIEMSMEITKTQDNNFATRPSTTAAKKLLYGCNDLGFAPYGKYWRQMKKMSVLRLLSVKRVQSFRFIREEEVALLIENISHLCQLRNSINLSELLTILSNNLISRAAFGSKFEEEDDNSRRIGPLTREVMPLLGMFSVQDFFP